MWRGLPLYQVASWSIQPFGHYCRNATLLRVGIRLRTIFIPSLVVKTFTWCMHWVIARYQLLTQVSNVSELSGKHSSDAPMLSAARTRTEFARRAFSVAAPHTWNSQPSDNRSCHTLHTFKKTSKHTCLDSLSLSHLRLCILYRTLRRYINTVLLLLLNCGKFTR